MSTLLTGLKVQGNHLIDGGGHTVQLRGGQIPGLNFSTWNNATTASNLSARTFTEMHAQWGMNVLRLPFSGYYMQADPTYLPKLDAIVQSANAAGLVVVLGYFGDSHAGNPNPGVAMPYPEAVGFWKTVAAHFASTTKYSVMFDLYNEPRAGAGTPSAADWQAWLAGGTVNGYTVVGVETLIATIRAVAATQPIVIQGLSGLQNISQHLPTESNLVYSAHTYFEGDLTTASWDTSFGYLAATKPVYIGEWAFLPNAAYPAMCSKLNLTTAQVTALVKSFLAYMDQKGMSYTAWAFTPTHLVVDMSSFTPTTIPQPMSCSTTQTTAGMGTLYKAHLLSLPPAI